MFEEKEIIEDGIDFENFDDDNFESIGDDNLEFSKIILRDILYYVYEYCYVYLYIRSGIFLDFYYFDVADQTAVCCSECLYTTQIR